jgi:C4-dicarboxylate-specific signal transduction histidine kinase
MLQQILQPGVDILLFERELQRCDSSFTDMPEDVLYNNAHGLQVLRTTPNTSFEDLNPTPADSRMSTFDGRVYGRVFQELQIASRVW